MNDPYILTPMLTFFGTLGGFWFGRKKNQAEAQKITADAHQVTYTGYERLIDNMQKQLDRQEGKIERLEEKVRKHICTVNDCPHRRR